MKGLIRKELLLLFRGNGLLFFIAGLLLAVGGGCSGEFSPGLVLCFSYAVMGTVSLMSMEEKWRWTAALRCGPVSSRQIVGAKYLSLTFQLLFCLLVFAGVNLLIHGGRGLFPGLTMLGYGMISAAVCMPLCFRFGANRGWVGLVTCLLVLTPMGLPMYVLVAGGDLDMMEWMNRLWFLLPAGAAAFGLSLPVSAALYAKRV